ncbi:hypothetical protein EJB05_25027, partial [Eragrostis curvula]
MAVGVLISPCRVPRAAAPVPFRSHSKYKFFKQMKRNSQKSTQEQEPAENVSGCRFSEPWTGSVPNVWINDGVME